MTAEFTEGFYSSMMTIRNRTVRIVNKVAPVTKADLQARVEKLERANAKLRVNIKELRRLYVTAAEMLDGLQGPAE